MAIVIKPLDTGVRESDGSKWETYWTIALDNSYPTGGYALLPSVFGLSQIVHMDLQPFLGFAAHYDFTNQKLKVYSASGTEVANTTNLTANSDVRAWVVGR